MSTATSSCQSRPPHHMVPNCSLMTCSFHTPHITNLRPRSGRKRAQCQLRQRSRRCWLLQRADKPAFSSSHHNAFFSHELAITSCTTIGMGGYTFTCVTNRWVTDCFLSQLQRNLKMAAQRVTQPASWFLACFHPSWCLTFFCQNHQTGPHECSSWLWQTL